MIHSYDYAIEHVGEIGLVEEVHDGLVKVGGLPGAFVGEGISFESGLHGRVMSLLEELVEVLVLSREKVAIGDRVARTGISLSITCSDGVLGHVLNPLGYSLTKRRMKSRRHSENRPIGLPPVGITSRRRIERYLETGTASVDLVVPLSKGQRELVIGDRQTGKTHFLLQTMVNQAKSGSVCIYAALGKQKAQIKRIEEFLTKYGVIKNCVIVAADSYATAGEIYLAPFTAMTLAEYFRDQDRDVFLVLDDMTTHAKYYREIALMAGRFPGRESYPGDIFHIQSKLLERAGCFDLGGREVSITCMPVAESLEGDFTGYIQTNLMSMTDGHLFFDSQISFGGRRPAVNIPLSVTRVGWQTQQPLYRDVGRQILLVLKKHDEAARFLRFGPEMTVEMKEYLRVGTALNHLFNQTGHWRIPVILAIILVSLIWIGGYDGMRANVFVRRYMADRVFRELVASTAGLVVTLSELNESVGKVKHEFSKLLAEDENI